MLSIGCFTVSPGNPFLSILPRYNAVSYMFYVLTLKKIGVFIAISLFLLEHLVPVFFFPPLLAGAAFVLEGAMVDIVCFRTYSNILNRSLLLAPCSLLSAGGLLATIRPLRLKMPQYVGGAVRAPGHYRVLILRRRSGALRRPVCLSVPQGRLGLETSQQ